MLGYFDIPRLTPQDINAIKADTERQQTQGVLDLSSMNAGLNLAHNLSPMGNLGFLLGTVGGRLLNNYYDKKAADRIEGRNKRTEGFKKLLDLSKNGEFFPMQTQTPIQNQYDFSSYSQVPKISWQPNPLFTQGW